MELVEESQTKTDKDDENINNNNQDNNNLKTITIFKIKKLILNFKNDIYDKLNLDTKFLLLNIFAFILYLISLIGCEKGEENICVTDFIIQFVLEGILVIINSIIVAININFIILKKIKWYHSIYLFLFYFLIAQFNYQFSLKKHGGYNLVFLIFFILLSLFLELLVYVFYLIYKKNKYLLYINISLIIILSITIDIFLNVKYNCNTFLLGLNNTWLTNAPDSGCNITKPSNCKMEFFYPILNLSKFIRPNYDSKKNFLMNKDKNKLKNSNRFGIPRINIFGNDVNFFDKDFLMRYVHENIIDMEKENIFNDSYPKPEVEITFDKKQRGTVHINVTKNETLINLRKKLENPNSLFDNIIVLYIDAVSRNRFLSTLPKTSKFINRFMSYNSEETEFGKFKSFQFFKYHSTGTFTQPNAQPMFYGNSMFSGSGVQITKYLKENGYITSMVFDQCVFEVFFDREKNFVYNVQSDNFDHSIMPLFCDQNYFGFLLRGVNAPVKRVFYGRNAFEYNFEYARQFWRNYNESKKYMLLGFMDAHEATSNVLHFIDDSLSNYFEEMYNNKLLKNTIVFFISDHGLHVSPFYFILAGDHYFHERSLPALFILFDDNKNIPKDEIYNNQQKFITGYDIYETLYHLIYGNNYIKQDICPEKRKSLFKFIDETNRNCNMYQEIKKSSCYCTKKK